MPDKPSLLDRLKVLQRNEAAVAQVVVSVLALYWGIDKGLELNSFWQGVMYTLVPWLSGTLASEYGKAYRGKKVQP